MLAGKLLQPDVCVLRHENEARHPVPVGAVALVLGLAAVGWDRRRARKVAVTGMADHFLTDEVHGAQQTVAQGRAKGPAPAVQEELELPFKRIGRGPGWREQNLNQTVGGRAHTAIEGRPGGKELIEEANRLWIAAC